MAAPVHCNNPPDSLLKSAKIVLVAVSVAIAVMLLVSCGGADDESTDTAGSTDPAAAVAAADRSDTTDVVAGLPGGSGARPDITPAGARTGNSNGQIEPVLDPLDIRGEIISEYSLVDGDCFNRFESLRAGRRLTVTSRIDCNEPHLAEVFHIFEVEAEHPAIYPGTDTVRNYALRVCYDEFEAFVGQSYELSMYEINVFIPTRTNFEHDVARYRGVHCWLHHIDDEQLLGSARDTAL